MIRLITRRRLERLQTERQTWREERNRALQAVLKLRTEGDLIKQALTAAEARETYWRVRAERFMDQIGASSGIISSPTMTDPEPAAVDGVHTVFSALGVDSINHEQRTSRPTASPVVSVAGVDARAAAAAIAESLSSVG